MGQYVLTVPDDVYRRARKIADQTTRPVDQVLIEHLRTLPSVLPPLPQAEEAELQALHVLSDDALWTIAREQMVTADDERLQALMQKNSLGTITQVEHTELGQLVERSQRLLLRKSAAAALLAERGHSITPSTLARRE